ncbi:MAG: 30S ribosomal protein S5 [Candidatus Wildermuthbacteria bacterium]|nr:30S ribosomal protein S5 [Candidatus Wildermuthbacteria bacterium]
MPINTDTPNTKKTRGFGRGPRHDRPPRPKDEFDPKLLDLARVARVAAGGRRFSFRAVVVAGDKKGRVGIGVAKGVDVAQAMQKATTQAKKHMITVSVEGNTIPYAVEAKFGSSRVLLRPQRAGRGLVAGGPVRIICEKAGIQDISAKFLSKTHNKLNNALVTIEALKKLRVKPKPVKPAEEPAKEVPMQPAAI